MPCGRVQRPPRGILGWLASPPMLCTSAWLDRSTTDRAVNRSEPGMLRPIAMSSRTLAASSVSLSSSSPSYAIAAVGPPYALSETVRRFVWIGGEALGVDNGAPFAGGGASFSARDRFADAVAARTRSSATLSAACGCVISRYRRSTGARRARSASCGCPRAHCAERRAAASLARPPTAASVATARTDAHSTGRLFAALDAALARLVAIALDLRQSAAERLGRLTLRCLQGMHERACRVSTVVERAD